MSEQAFDDDIAEAIMYTIREMARRKDFSNEVFTGTHEAKVVYMYVSVYVDEFKMYKPYVAILRYEVAEFVINNIELLRNVLNYFKKRSLTKDVIDQYITMCKNRVNTEKAIKE